MTTEHTDLSAVDGRGGGPPLFDYTHGIPSMNAYVRAMIYAEANPASTVFATKASGGPADIPTRTGGQARTHGSAARSPVFDFGGADVVAPRWNPRLEIVDTPGGAAKAINRATSIAGFGMLVADAASDIIKAGQLPTKQQRDRAYRQAVSDAAKNGAVFGGETAGLWALALASPPTAAILGTGLLVAPLVLTGQETVAQWRRHNGYRWQPGTYPATSQVSSGSTLVCHRSSGHWAGGNGKRPPLRLWFKGVTDIGGNLWTIADAASNPGRGDWERAYHGPTRIDADNMAKIYKDWVGASIETTWGAPPSSYFSTSPYARRDWSRMDLPTLMAEQRRMFKSLYKSGRADPAVITEVERLGSVIDRKLGRRTKASAGSTPHAVALPDVSQLHEEKRRRQAQAVRQRQDLAVAAGLRSAAQSHTAGDLRLEHARAIALAAAVRRRAAAEAAAARARALEEARRRREALLAAARARAEALARAEYYARRHGGR